MTEPTFEPTYTHLTPPAAGTPIRYEHGRYRVPDDPIIPFIEGDGTGRDIWKASRRVFDAAVATAFGDEKKIYWFPIYAGEYAKNHGLGDEQYGGWISDDTFEAMRAYHVAIKGPLTTPVGEGIRSLNVMIRQVLDLYTCYRPVYWIEGVPSPVKHPEKIDLHVFRENSEDIYLGLEWRPDSEPARKLIDFINREISPLSPDTAGKLIRAESGIGVKSISAFGTRRLAKMAIEYAIHHPRRDGKPSSVTIMHKGNIMKFTEGVFKTIALQVGREHFRGRTVSERESWVLENKARGGGTTEENARRIEPGFDMLSRDDQQKVLREVEAALHLEPSHGDGKWKEMTLLKDRIADSTFQQILLRPDEYDVIMAPNLNGDYISDAAAAQVGGLGLAPGSNIGDGIVLAEATHGTAPKYADKDVINPSSLMLSGVIMFDWMGGEWAQVGEIIKRAIQRTVRNGTVTYDLHRQMLAAGREDAKKLKTSEYADEVIKNMQPV